MSASEGISRTKAKAAIARALCADATDHDVIVGALAYETLELLDKRHGLAPRHEQRLLARRNFVIHRARVYQQREQRARELVGRFDWFLRLIVVVNSLSTAGRRAESVVDLVGELLPEDRRDEHIGDALEDLAALRERGAGRGALFVTTLAWAISMLRAAVRAALSDAPKRRSR